MKIAYTLEMTETAERADMKICYDNKNYKIKLHTIYLQSSLKDKNYCLSCYLLPFLYNFIYIQFKESLALYLVSLFHGTLLTILPIYFTMSFYHIALLFSLSFGKLGMSFQVHTVAEVEGFCLSGKLFKFVIRNT